MKSDLPKVLLQVCGRPMLDYVLDALAAANIRQMIVVVGHRADLVQARLDGRPGIRFALQAEQLGTGHAVMACRDLLAEHDGAVLVVTGDAPMMQAASVSALLAEYSRSAASCVIGTIHKQDPAGLGRILRNERGDFAGIIEEKDATPEQRRITEVNMSYYVFNCRDLLESLEQIRADNVQGEYYLTDVPGVLVSQGKPVRALPALQPCEALGINTVEELAAVEKALQKGEGRTPQRPEGIRRETQRTEN